ncbi:MAG TPA: alpha/beta hydrolase [Ktedonobacteraceae bacterium]|nr:alpha/beta hydrolase [Ktedonobacteraceae bacterium]
MMMPRSAFIDAEDVRLHYLEWEPTRLQTASAEEAAEQDSDNIPVVMLHSLGATADTWRLLAKHLCRQHDIIAFDQRGHGQSDKPASGYDLVTLAEDAIRGMAALGLGQVALVGHGWGARVALVLAARHPALISHLILVDCPHVEPRHWPGMTRERFIRTRSPKELYTSRETFLQPLRQEMHAFWSAEIEEIFLTYIQELPDGSVEEWLQPEHQREIRESLWEDRALPYYSKVSCPVLLVPAAAQPQPGDELPERLENAEEFAAAKGYMALQVARAIHCCTVLWMPDPAHDIQLQHPQLLAKAIIDFVRT